MFSEKERRGREGGIKERRREKVAKKEKTEEGRMARG